MWRDMVGHVKYSEAKMMKKNTMSGRNEGDGGGIGEGRKRSGGQRRREGVCGMAATKRLLLYTDAV
jgi:hypothetical protein